MTSPTNKESVVERVVSLRHGGAILSIFEAMFEPWMDDGDKAELMAMSLQATGKTLEDMDEDLETGLQNGYSIEFQVELCRKLFSG